MLKLYDYFVVYKKYYIIFQNLRENLNNVHEFSSVTINLKKIFLF